MQIQPLTFSSQPTTGSGEESKNNVVHSLSGVIRTLFFEDPLQPTKNVDYVKKLHKTSCSRLSFLPSDLINFYLIPMLAQETLQIAGPNTDRILEENLRQLNRVEVEEPVNDLLIRYVNVMDNGNIVITQHGAIFDCSMHKRIYSAKGQLQEIRSVVKSYELQCRLEESTLIHHSFEGVKTTTIPFYVLSVHVDEEGNIFFIGRNQIFAVTKDLTLLFSKSLENHTFLHYPGKTLSQTFCVNSSKKLIYTILMDYSRPILISYDFMGNEVNSKCLQMSGLAPRFLKLYGNGNLLIDSGSSIKFCPENEIFMITDNSWTPIFPASRGPQPTSNDAACILNNGQVYVFNAKRSCISIYERPQ